MEEDVKMFAAFALMGVLNASKGLVLQLEQVAQYAVSMAKALAAELNKQV